MRASHLSRPLVEAVIEQIARKGAYPILQLSFEQIGGPFAREAPLELLREPAPLQRRIWEEVDAFIAIFGPENMREGAELSDERQAAIRQMMAPMRERTMALEAPWVVAEYPVDSAAQDAGMTLGEYEEFIFDAVLRDWDAEGERMRKIADVFDAADEVRIVGPGTDLTLSLAGRTGAVDDGHVEHAGRRGLLLAGRGLGARRDRVLGVPGGLLREPRSTARGSCSTDGTIVDASARSGEPFLLQTLDTDAGARRLGELGIGCNPGIQRFMKNVAFDEKIDGTIHLAVGNSYSFTGGMNESSIHWDIVKDLRTAGQLYADGRLVQENGAWTISVAPRAQSAGCEVAISPASRAFATIRSRFARSVRPPLSRCRNAEHERRHGLSVHALRGGVRERAPRSAARRRRGSRRAAARAADRRRRAPSGQRRSAPPRAPTRRAPRPAGPPRAA